MYSELIVDKALHRLRQNGIAVQRRDVAQCREISRRLKDLKDAKTGHYIRTLTTDELAFVRSETILCRHDFRYFAQRYGTIDLDASTGGGVGPM